MNSIGPTATTTTLTTATTTTSTTSTFTTTTSSNSTDMAIGHASSSSSTSSEQISVTASPDPLQQGINRRRFVTQLNLFGTLIRNSGLNDPMTNALAVWQRNFTTALKASQDETGVIAHFTGELQRLIGNTFATAPLDERFNYGNQRQIYHDLQQVLRRLNLIPPPQAIPIPQTDEEKKIDRIYARSVRTNRLEQQGLLRQRIAHRNQLSGRVAEIRNEVSHRMEALRDRVQQRENQTLDQIAILRENNREHFLAMENWIEQSSRRDGQALGEIEAQFAERVADQRGAWQQSAEALERVRAENREELERIDLFLRNALTEILTPFAREVREFAQQETVVIHRMTRENQERAQASQVRYHQLRQQVDHVVQGNQELRLSRERVAEQLTHTIEQERILQRCIRETEEVINRMEESRGGSLNPFALVAIAIIVTCGAQYMAVSSGSSASATFTPFQGGGGLVRIGFAF